MQKSLSAYKHKRLAVESLRNALRLLKDAISLYKLGSYPTAFQLSVLALEEYAKARWVDHVYYSSITNGGLAKNGEDQEWLKLLYLHTKKHAAFVGWDYFEFSKAFHKLLTSDELELRKQKATYVGLPRIKGKVDVNGRISTPASISKNNAKQLISVVVSELREVYHLIDISDSYFGIEDMDDVIRSHEIMFAFSWPHRTKLKSKNRYLKANQKRKR